MDEWSEAIRSAKELGERELPEFFHACTAVKSGTSFLISDVKHKTCRMCRSEEYGI